MDNHNIAHYDTFVKVDTFYYRKMDLQPSVWLKDIKIVHDPDGFMKTIHQVSKNLSYAPTIKEIEIWRTKFFAYVHEAYRRAMRGEFYYALHCIDDLRLSMISAWYMEAGIPPNTFGDWAKLEGDRSKLQSWQLTLISEWHCGRDHREILSVIKSMIPEFKKVHKQLCEKNGLEENLLWVEEILEMVL